MMNAEEQNKPYDCSVYNKEFNEKFFLKKIFKHILKITSYLEGIQQCFF